MRNFGFYTDAIGYNEYYELQTKFSDDGHWWNNHDGDNPFNNGQVREPLCMKFAVKPSPIQGDHYHDYDYGRRGGRIVSMGPSTVTEHYNYGGGAGMEWNKHFNLAYSIPYLPNIGDPPEWYGPRLNNSSRSLTKALLKLKAGKVQNGVDIIEAKKTANLVAETASQIARGIIAAKRGQWGLLPSIFGMSPKQVRNLQGPANKWLEYQYGWKPLFNSVYDNTLLLASTLQKRDATFMVKSTTGVQDDYSSGTVSPSINNWHCESYTKTSFTAAPSNEFIEAIDKCGLLNPLSIAWELTPFSFVVDWFAPVGNVLDALSAPLGLQFVKGYRTVTNFRQLTVSLNQRYYQSAPGVNPQYEVKFPGGCSVELYDFVRYAMSGWPIPEPYLNNSPFSTSRVLSAAALVAQALGRR